MSNTKYNGWTNYPTFNINTWITNEQESYLYWAEEALYHFENAEPTNYLTRSEVARINLSNQIEECFTELSLDNNGEAGPLTDILGWALGQVNWSKIADSLLAADVPEYEEVA